MDKKEDLNSIGTLELESIKRKKRLEELRNKRKLNNNSNETIECNLPKPKFRSYNPINEELKKNTLTKTDPESVEKHIQNHLTALKKNNSVEEIDLVNLAPKKIDWDLKRHIENDLKKLEKKTEKAIADLVRERIKNEQLKE